MGYQYVTREICASLSRHNTEQDDKDNELWAEVIDRIHEIVNDPKYQSIGLDWM